MKLIATAFHALFVLVGPRVAANAGWGLADRLVRGLGNAAIGILLARHLGPSEYGLLGFCVALSTVAWVLTTVGAEPVVIGELVRAPSPEKERRLLATSLRLRLLGALAGVAFCVGAVLLLRPGNHLALGVAAIIAAGSFFQAFDVFDLAWQARQHTRPVALIRLGAALLCIGLRLGLVLMDAPLLAIAATFTFELALTAWAFARAWRFGVGDGWDWDASLAWAQTKTAFPLLLSALAVVLSLRLDQVLLTALLDDHANGTYVAGIRLIEPWYIPAVVLGTAIFPQLVHRHRSGHAELQIGLDQQYRLMTWPFLAAAGLMWAGAGLLVDLAYGERYAGSTGVLQIYAWTIPAYALGIAIDRYLLTVGDNRATLVRTLVGLAVNLSANLALIPVLGAEGAAWASVVGQWSSVLVLGCWPAHRGQLRAIGRAVFRPRRTLGGSTLPP